jgi:hypothetical protein
MGSYANWLFSACNKLLLRFYHIAIRKRDGRLGDRISKMVRSLNRYAYSFQLYLFLFDLLILHMLA